MRCSRSALLLVLLAAGCERADSDTKTIERSLATVSVTIDDLGSEPRVPLRMHRTAGTHHKLESTLSIDFERAGKAYPGWTSHEVAEVDILDVSDDGTSHSRRTVIDASAHDHPSAHRRDAPPDPRVTIGRSVESWYDPRGVATRGALSTRNLHDKPDEDTRPIEFQTVAPVEAVGVGARWTEHLELPGRTATVHSELLARDGDRVRFRVTFEATRTMWTSPTTDVGTIMYDYDLAGIEYAMHETKTATIHMAQGDATATETSQTMTVP